MTACRSILPAFVLLAPAAAHAQATAPLEADSLLAHLAAFDAALDPANALSGVILVVQNGNVVLHEGFGLADRSHGVPNGPETRFCIASITKLMTRVVVYQLLLEERLRMDQTLATFVPEFPRGDEITVEDLFRHRAGIPHRVTGSCETCTPMNAEAMTERAMAADLLVEPGSESIYSSAGYSVLARVVEIVEGESFSEVLRARVFEPAGMTHTVDVDARVIVPHLARSYMPGRGTLLNAPPIDLSYLVGAGSVISTAEDLYRFLIAYRDGVLGEGAWQMEGTGPVAWTGATNGFHAYLNYYPDTETVFVYTGNTFGGGAGDLHGKLDALLAGERVMPDPIPDARNPVDAAVLTRYVGEYGSRPGATMSVSVRDGELLIADSVALPLSETRFFFQNWMRALEFVPAEGGGWSLRSGDDVWPRVSSVGAR